MTFNSANALNVLFADPEGIEGGVQPQSESTAAVSFGRRGGRGSERLASGLGAVGSVARAVAGESPTARSGDVSRMPSASSLGKRPGSFCVQHWPKYMHQTFRAVLVACICFSFSNVLRVTMPLAHRPLPSPAPAQAQVKHQPQVSIRASLIVSFLAGRSWRACAGACESTCWRRCCMLGALFPHHLQH